MSHESIFPQTATRSTMITSEIHPQTHDRIHLLSIFHSKASELTLEIQRLRMDRDALDADKQQYNSLCKTVEELQNELEDYNMARMNSFCDVMELRKEIDDLHAHNQHMETLIDELDREKQRKEERIQQLDDELSNEKNSDEISILERRLNRIRNQTSDSTIHQEAFALIDQISELQSKHDQLLIENPTLQLTVHFEEELVQCFNEIQKAQNTNLELLSFISQTLILANVPQLGITLEQRNSTTTLTKQYRKVRQDLLKLESLDQRLIEELGELRIQFTSMQEDIRKFNDLESVKHQAERRKQQLIAVKINMSQQKLITQMEIETLQSQFETLQTQLQTNQNHQQLVQLEQKLQTFAEMPARYEPIKQQALALVHTHNQWLIHQLKPLS